METLTTEQETKINTYIRTGKIRVEPIRRSSDWLLPESDSAFMNAGAKQEYVVPNSLRTGALIDPLWDLTQEQLTEVTTQLGFKNNDALNVNKPNKENYWINRPVILDRYGKHLYLSNISDFIAYRILKVNTDYIAPSYEERYNKGTYKFALVSENEESKLKISKVDIKKEAWMLFGKIDGSARKMADFLWIYFLLNVDKEAKRPPNNPSIEYCKAEVGRIIDEKVGMFLQIMTDPEFETKALIQRGINNGLIHRDGMTFTVFGETSSKSNLEGLIGYLKDERNNNIRLSLIGKLQVIEEVKVEPVKAVETIKVEETPSIDPNIELLKKLEEVQKENEELRKIIVTNTGEEKKKPGRPSSKEKK